jgi:deoxyxylulose-5-phosphate synthase
MELDVAPSSFLTLAQDIVEDAEELRETLFPSTMASGGHLNAECVDRGVVTNHGDAAVAVSVTTGHLVSRRKSGDFDELVCVIGVLDHELSSTNSSGKRT